ncbi:MAG TPA: SAM-dependent chlorinase/fluorinase [Longilinea sp.]|nr:SAM-dependent chlorinase/fluorinase [Longilinea sp.]
MSVISITTDFGQKDGFVGTMKGVIWKICPQAQIADITHDVPPQDIFTAAIALWRTVPFFPAGSIHIAVVDPGVGTQRRPMAARLGDQYVVGPDNGLFTLLIQTAEKDKQPVALIHLNQPEYWLPTISRTFHGRDIFAPVAAHMANGVPLEKLGSPFTDPVLLEIAQPERTENGWIAHVTVIDAFGNITTDLNANLLGGRRDVRLRLGKAEVSGIIASYGQRNPGDLVAVVDSEGFIEIAVVNGSAAARLGAKLGDVIEILIPSGLQ